MGDEKQKKAPEFSIIIPVYNVATYLRKCLDSVRAQTFTDWEAICVDDGSTDESGVILDEYASRDSRFVVIHQVNQGVNFARQRALDASKGMWIATVDSDDWICSEYFSSLHLALKGSCCEFAWCDYYTVKGNVVERHCHALPEDAENLQVRHLKGDWWVANWDKIYRRSFLKEHQISFYTKERLVFCEDALFNFATLSCRPVVKYIPYAGYYYRLRGDSLAHSALTMERLNSWALVTNEYLKFALSDEVRKWIDYQKRVVKAYTYSAPLIPNQVFNALYPEIRSLKGHTIALRHKVLFWLAVRGFRTPILWFYHVARSVLKKHM